VLEDSLQDEVFKLAMNFRNYWKNVITGLETQKMIKAIQYADKQDYKFIVIFGEEEKEKWIYKVKNLKSWKEKEFKLNEDFSVEELN
jgi:histidyl-tRNA synthetase